IVKFSNLIPSPYAHKVALQAKFAACAKLFCRYAGFKFPQGASMTDLERLRNGIRELPRWQTYAYIGEQCGLSRDWLRNFMLAREGAAYRAEKVERLSAY